MNLARHAAVLWRFRLITALGLLLGIGLAIFAMYQVPSMQPRGAETWSSESSLMVTQPGCPECRVILPAPIVVDKDGDGQPDETDVKQQAFADPGRFTFLADLYAQLAVSDQVLSRVPEKPAPAQIQAMTVQSTSGAITLPVIKLTTMAATPMGAQQLNLHMVDALRSHLEREQAGADVSKDERVQLSLISRPTPPFMVAGPSKTGAILAFMLCLIGTIAVTHLLEALRNRKKAAADPELDDAVSEFVDPWTLREGEFAETERRPVAVAQRQR
jgi:hypothetical protein